MQRNVGMRKGVQNKKTLRSLRIRKVVEKDCQEIELNQSPDKYKA